MTTTAPRVLVLACGALARELTELVRTAGFEHLSVSCLPAQLHNTPDQIPEAVRTRIHEARTQYDEVFVGYADCGTGGRLDAVCEQEGVQRLPGAHCYELFAGREVFAALHDDEPGTFYLTDYLVRSFERLVIGPLGLDRHPELTAAYFGNYRRLVYLAQTDDPALVEQARDAARRLGLRFELRRTGFGELEPVLRQVAAGARAATAVGTATGAAAGARASSDPPADAA